MKLIKVIEFRHAYRAPFGEGSIALYKELRGDRVLRYRANPPEHYE